MKSEQSAFGITLLMLIFTVATMLFGINLLWKRTIHFHTDQLSKQILLTLEREVSEGNFFKVSATLDRLRMARLYKEIAVIEINKKNKNWLYSSNLKIQSDAFSTGLLDKCFLDNIPIIEGENLYYIVKLKDINSNESGICAFVSTELSDELLKLRNTIILIFSITATLIFSLLSYLLMRIGKQQFKLQHAEITKQIEKAEALSRLAAQVSHDIRSPLSALNMILSQLNKIPEDQRIIIREATQRINDIANQLLMKSKERENKNVNNKNDSLLLPALVDLIVSEKRIQFRDLADLTIEADINDAYGAFISFPALEFNRILSNLINNSVEALPLSKGIVKVGVRRYSKQIQIIISDNGKGIPANILPQIGKRGFSYDKKNTTSGSGLGIYHAKHLIETNNGSFEITSKEAEGTLISILFPSVSPPKWFKSKLEITTDTEIVILDDDIVIHEIWRERFSMQNLSVIKIYNFTISENFKSWFHSSTHKNLLCLIDYELLDQQTTGLDLVEELGIQNSSILITSHYDDIQIQNRCIKLDVSIIPKGMAPFIPIKVVERGIRPNKLKNKLY